MEACLILLFAYFVWLAARRRRNWPRWALTAALVLSAISVVQVIGQTGLQFDTGVADHLLRADGGGIVFVIYRRRGGLVQRVILVSRTRCSAVAMRRRAGTHVVRQVLDPGSAAHRKGAALHPGNVCETAAPSNGILYSSHPMEWTDEGIVLGVRRHGKSSAIVELLTRGHGRHLGLVRGGASKRMRPMLQPGNSVSAVWRARLDEHLGYYVIEGTRLRAATVLASSHATYGVTPSRLAGAAAAGTRSARRHF